MQPSPAEVYSMMSLTALILRVLMALMIWASETFRHSQTILDLGWGGTMSRESPGGRMGIFLIEI